MGKYVRSALSIITLTLVLAMAVGCGVVRPSSATSDGPTPTRALSPDDQASIYAAVIRQLATVDDTFGGNLKPSKLFVIRETDDKAGNPTGGGTFSSPIPQTVQDKITDALRDLPAEILWIDKFGDAEFEEGENMPIKSVKDGGAIITLGSARLQDDGSAQVAGSIYIGGLAAGGTTYVLEKREGNWTVTGATGVRWMS